MGRGASGGGRGGVGGGFPEVSKNRDGTLNPGYFDKNDNPAYPQVGGRSALPDDFRINKNIDTSKASITTRRALEIEKEKNKFGNPGSIVTGAARRVINDHQIRSNGRKMQAKYAGTDAVTGANIKVGDKIIFLSGVGAILDK